MTSREFTESLAFELVEPDEAERADVRWAVQMEAMHAFAGSAKPLPPLWWLQQLPWRPEYVSPEERVRRQAERDRQMGEFHRAYLAAKAAKKAKAA